MTRWYHKITESLDNIPAFVGFYEREHASARIELSLKGKSIEKHAADLPGMVEHRFSQLQEIEAVLEYLNIRLNRDRSRRFKKYLESYNRTLSSRDAEKYVDGEDDIVELMLVINEVALLRNKFLSISKGFDAKNFMISNTTKLRVAGLDDATII